jgi:hypothetical protein
MVSPPGVSPILVPQKPNWLARNWKWVVPVAVVGLFVVLASFVGSILLIVETSIQHSDFYPVALARARATPEALEKLGQPIQTGWLASGSINISGSSGNADVSIPLRGPRGKGTLYVVAKKSAGEWKFETLQVEIAGETRRIDLLQTSGQ